jgi:hypothetical protein
MSRELLAIDISSIVGYLLEGISTLFIRSIFVLAPSPLLIILCSLYDV